VAVKVAADTSGPERISSCFCLGMTFPRPRWAILCCRGALNSFRCDAAAVRSMESKEIVESCPRYNRKYKVLA
jgi:hypothetical protein